MRNAFLQGACAALLLAISAACTTTGVSTDKSLQQQELTQQSLEDPDNILVAPQENLIDPDARPGGTLRRSRTSESAGFNWLMMNSVDVVEIQGYVHNQFARQDFSEPDNYVPDLAHKITANDDFTEYTIHLRPDIYWQIPAVDLDDPGHQWLNERRELTAEDAAFYFEMAIHPDVDAAYLSNYVEDIETVEVLDRYTLRVTWKRPIYHSRSTTAGAYPLPKWLYSRERDGTPIADDRIAQRFEQHWSNDHPVGTGPYRFVDYRPGDRLVLERDPQYWGIPPAIKRIEYRFIYDSEETYSHLVNGNLDIIESLDSRRYRAEILEGDSSSPFQRGDLEYEIIDQFAYFYIGWNADGPLFSDAKVRRAMTMAFDRQSMIDDVWHGLGEVQTGPYFYTHPGNNPDIEALPFDLDGAAELLDEAGWDEIGDDGIRRKEIDGELERFEFTLTSYNKPEHRHSAADYAEALKTIGVEMNTDFIGWTTMQHRMAERDFDAFTGGWGLAWEVGLYQIWHSSQADTPGGSNHVSFRHAEADELIEELRVTFDPDERISLLRQFHTIVHEEQPYTFLYAPKQVVAWNPRLENVVFQKIRPQAYSLPWYFGD